MMDPNSEQPVGASELRSSVFYSQNDTNQDDPALPVLNLVNHLRTRHGNTPYTDDFVKAVEEADKNGDGLINIPELILVLESMQNLKKENTGLKKYLAVAFGVLLLVLCSIFGLVFAVVQLTKEVSASGTSDNPNALVSKTTGVIVDTHPSDGGGIVLDMVAFTQPVNMTFPGLDNKQDALECVGQISTDSIDKNYDKFTTGGSSMTIRYVDYSRSTSPVVYTYIPGSNVEVSGSNPRTGSADNIAAAQQITEAVIEAQASGRRLMEVKAEIMQQNQRSLQFDDFGGFDTFGPLYTSGSIQCNECYPECPVDQMSQSCISAFDEQESTRITSGKNRNDSDDDDSDSEDDSDDDDRRHNRRKNRRRRKLQGAGTFQYKTVDGYMKSFATQENDITFTKDLQISDQYYFVCLAPPTST